MNVLTVDLEEWFHILDNDSTRTEDEWVRFESRFEENAIRVVRILQKKGVHATFFVLGWIARKYPDIIKEISSLGYEIGSHSDMHQLVYKQSEKDFARDLANSIESIERITGKRVRCYRAPGFSITADSKWVFPILASNGIEIDCSIFPARRAHGGYKEFEHAKPVILCGDGYEIKELPISIRNILKLPIAYSGGGYFRLLPYKAIASLMGQDDYNMMYFHPRDFDNNQPIIKDLSLIRRFKSYYGLRGAYRKFERLLDSFDFVDVGQFVNETNWNDVERIHL